MRRPEIYVSACPSELGSYRRAIGDHLRDRGFQPVLHEPTGDYRTFVAALRAQMAPCSAIICLVGTTYGDEPAERPDDAPRRSYSQLEFEIASALKKPIFVFLSTEECQPDRPSGESDRVRNRQLEHRRKVESKNLPRQVFGSLDELRAQIRAMRWPGELVGTPLRPWNLPFDTLGPLFKGRDEDLDRLRQTLKANTGRAVVAPRPEAPGPGGVGTTRLAVEYAMRAEAGYAAVLYVNADSRDSLFRNLAALCGSSALNLPEREDPRETARYAAVMAWLESHPGWLLLLDGVDTPDVAASVEKRFPRLAKGHVIVTTRLQEWGGDTRVELDPLSPTAAGEYLLARTAGHRHASTADNEDSVSLAIDLEGLPVPLELAGAFIAQHNWPLRDYWERLSARAPFVSVWYEERRASYPFTVAVTWQVTADKLTQGGRALLDVLAWLAPDPIPVDMIRAERDGTGLIPGPKAALKELTAHGLIRWADGNRAVYLPRLVRQVTRDLAGDSYRAQCVSAALGMAERYAADHAPSPRTVAFWATFQPHAVSIVEAAADSGIASPTDRLLNRLAEAAEVRGDVGSAEALYRQIAAFSRTQEWFEAVAGLARVLRTNGKANEAVEACKGLAAAMETAQLSPGAAAKYSLAEADSLLAAGRWADAEPIYRKALVVLERTEGPHRPTTAQAVLGLARVYAAAERPAEAESHFRRALAVAEETGGPLAADCLAGLARVLDRGGRAAETIATHRRSIVAAEAAYGPSHPAVAKALARLAYCLCRTEPSSRGVLWRIKGVFNPAPPNPEIDGLFRRAIRILQDYYAPVGGTHPDLTAITEAYASFRKEKTEPGSELVELAPTTAASS